MDLTETIKAVFGGFTYYLPLILLLALTRTAWFKGVAGEFMVNLTARLWLDKRHYHLIKNVTLPTQDGSTQIDHIIVSRYGVFVVETKNLKGWIFGSERQPQWTQKIYRHSYKFQNPLRQNYRHVKTLQQLLGLEDHQIHSVVVFVGGSTFKTPMPANVTYAGGYVRYIQSFTQVVLGEEQVRQVVQAIAEKRLAPSLRTQLSHVCHVRQAVVEKQAGMVCPVCESAMVRRKAKDGANGVSEVSLIQGSGRCWLDWIGVRFMWHVADFDPKRTLIE